MVVVGAECANRHSHHRECALRERGREPRTCACTTMSIYSAGLYLRQAVAVAERRVFLILFLVLMGTTTAESTGLERESVERGEQRVGRLTVE